MGSGEGLFEVPSLSRTNVQRLVLEEQSIRIKRKLGKECSSYFYLNKRNIEEVTEWENNGLVLMEALRGPWKLLQHKQMTNF